MKKTTLSAIVIALAASSAFAAPPTPPTSQNPNMPPAPQGQPGGPGGEHHGGPGGRHMFEDIDANHDGSISKDEWVAHGEKMFKDFDANHDGKISQDEMKAFEDMKRAQWEQRRAQGGDSMRTPATNAAPKN